MSAADHPDTQVATDSEPPASSATRLLAQVATWMLPGSPTPPPVAPHQAEALVDAAVAYGLLGPLVAAIDAGEIELPSALRQRAVDAHEASMWWCLLVEKRLTEIQGWFQARGGIEYLVVKGPAVAHLDHLDPSLRSYGDLDILVAGHCMDRALEVLAAHGAVRSKPPRRPGFDARFGKGVGTRFTDGIEVDVHRSFCAGAHGFRIPLERIFATPDTFGVGGFPIPAPAKVHRALHACYHAVVSSPTPPLRTVCDLGWYLTDPDLTPDVLAREARLWRADAVLAEAVEVAVGALATPLPQWRRWLASTAIDTRERDLIRKDREPSNLPFHWSTVRELGWRDRVEFIWAVAVPSAEVLRARGQTPLGRVATGLKRLMP